MPTRDAVIYSKMFVHDEDGLGLPSFFYPDNKSVSCSTLLKADSQRWYQGKGSMRGGTVYRLHFVCCCAYLDIWADLTEFVLTRFYPIRYGYDACTLLHDPHVKRYVTPFYWM